MAHIEDHAFDLVVLPLTEPQDGWLTLHCYWSKAAQYAPNRVISIKSPRHAGRKVRQPEPNEFIGRNKYDPDSAAG